MRATLSRALSTHCRVLEFEGQVAKYAWFCCRSIIEKTAMSNITFDVSTLVRANAIDIHAPVMPAESVRTQTAIAFSGEVFPYALIIIACVILILGIAGIVYICVSWSR